MRKISGTKKLRRRMKIPLQLARERERERKSSLNIYVRREIISSQNNLKCTPPRRKKLSQCGSAYHRVERNSINAAYCYYKCWLIVIEICTRPANWNLYDRLECARRHLTMICAMQCSFCSKTATRNNWSTAPAPPPRIRGN